MNGNKIYLWERFETKIELLLVSIVIITLIISIAEMIGSLTQVT